MDAPFLSLIVPAYNEAEELPRTLPLLNAHRRQLAVPTELIVVDNHSTDATPTVAANHGARVVFEPVNQIARARNAGAREASGENLLFIDADTHPPLAALQAVVRHFQNEPALLGGGASVEFEGEIDAIARWGVNRWNAFARRFSLAAGSFFWVRRTAFDAVGGFPEARYAGEEIGLADALKAYGKPRGQRLLVLRETIPTSPRKLDWYGGWSVSAQMLLLAACPFLLRHKWFCRLWYRRPA